jgi:hypothetical protein
MGKENLVIKQEEDFKELSVVGDIVNELSSNRKNIYQGITIEYC